jgi:hypothetical protein
MQVREGARAKQAEHAAGEPVTSLWPALWGAYGWPYLSLGLIKLSSDVLNFAGTSSRSSLSPRNAKCFHQ